MNAIAPAAISIPKDGNNFINKLLFGFCGFEGGSKISILSSHITVFSRVFLEISDTRFFPDNPRNQVRSLSDRF